jgi:RNA polymerase sigma-70 factor, ECF subfamily
MPDHSEMQSQFEACVESCADSIYRVAFRLTGNDTLARELVQNTYLEAWRNLKSLRDFSKLRSWIFAILRNQFSKLIRTERRSIATSDSLGDISDEKKPSDGSVDWVQRAIDCLEEKYKLPLMLVAIDQMPVETAAEVLNIPKGTVLSRLHRGREKLRQIMIRQKMEQGV